MDIFTDGSCNNNGKRNAVAGSAIYIPKLKKEISAPVPQYYI